MFSPWSNQSFKTIICDAFRNLLPLVQFKKCKKHPWRGATFYKYHYSMDVVNVFLNRTNSKKLPKASHIKVSMIDVIIQLLYFKEL